MEEAVRSDVSTNPPAPHFILRAEGFWSRATTEGLLHAGWCSLPTVLPHEKRDCYINMWLFLPFTFWTEWGICSVSIWVNHTSCRSILFIEGYASVPRKIPTGWSSHTNLDSFLGGWTSPCLTLFLDKWMPCFRTGLILLILLGSIVWSLAPVNSCLVAESAQSQHCAWASGRAPATQVRGMVDVLKEAALRF